MSAASRRRPQSRTVLLDRALEALPLFRLSDSSEDASVSFITDTGGRWRVLPAPGERLPGTFDQDVYVELLRRFHEAKMSRAPQVTAWGSGSPRREFMHVDDLAAGVLHLLGAKDPPDWINIGCGEDITIRELAQLVKESWSGVDVELLDFGSVCFGARAVRQIGQDSVEQSFDAFAGRT